MVDLIKKDITETLSTAFLNYAGYNIQRRAIPDVRDGLKWGARQLLYSQMLGGFTYNKPFKKAIKSVSQAMGFCYLHGDASAYGTFIRMAKPFSYRIPLQEANGNYGTLINPDDHSASRYVELRGSEVAAKLLEDLNKDTITEWEDTYDLEGKFPKVLPSKSFWNLINGCISIGSGLACSIPPTNLIEVNNALIKLLQNPNISNNDILCLPDFPTGGIILNGNEVKQSMLNGTGAACKIRAIINYNKDEHCLIVEEMPYSTFTNTVCNELAVLIESEPNCGIKDFKDYTGIKPDLRIYLEKKADYKKVLCLLYEKTSLQSYFTINMVMLDKGITPKVFTWREALQAHIDHEKEVYRRSFEFDLTKIEHRLHIIDGLLVCLASIDEVIQIIKAAPSASTASSMLQIKFLLDEEQAKAVLAIKLASLAKLEVKKLEDEKIKLTEEANRIKIILQNEKEFNQQLINGWEETSYKFGDARRTRVLMEEPIEEAPEKILKEITILINLNGDYIVKEGKSNLKSFKKGKVVYKMNGTTAEKYYIFSNLGKCYCVSGEKIFGEPTGKIQELLKFDENEEIINAFSSDMEDKVAFIATKLGQIKKLSLDEIKSIKKDKTYIGLQDYDSVIDVKFGFGDEKIAIASRNGYIVIFEGNIISETKLPSKGVLGIKLKELTDEVASMTLVTNETNFICTITTKGFIKKTNIEEYPTTTRGTKGRLACKLNNDELIEIIAFDKYENIYYSKVFNEIDADAIPQGTRTSRGIDILKM